VEESGGGVWVRVNLEDAMRRVIRRLVSIIVIGVAAYVGFVMVLLAMNYSFPTSETLANGYLGEVTHGTARELDTPFLQCTASYIQHDGAQYSGAEVRGVRVTVSQGTGSSDTVEFPSITFQYHLSNTSEWQNGSIDWLTTDFKLFQARHLYCAG
jgi:hypothetical protein